MTVASAQRPPAERRPTSPPLAALGIAGVISAVLLIVTLLAALNQTYMDLEIEALDPETGDVTWALAKGVNGYPHLGDDSIVIIEGNSIAALSSDGTQRWRVDGVRAHSLLATGGIVYAATTENNASGILLVIDERTGDVLWESVDRRVYRAGDQSVVLRAPGGTIEVVAARSGEVVATVGQRVTNAAIDVDLVAVLARRSLRLIHADTGTLTVVEDIGNRKLLALSDPVAVLERGGERADDETGPRPRELTAYDVDTGDVRWAISIDKYDHMVQDGRTFGFWRGSTVTNIDAMTGTVLHISESAVAAEPRRTRTANGFIIVEQAEAFEGEFGDIDYYVVGRRDQESPSLSTFAVDAQSGAVLWSMDGASVAASNRTTAVLDDGRAFITVVAATGTPIDVFPKKRRPGVLATDRWIAIVAGTTLEILGEDGRTRLTVDPLGGPSRIVAATGDTIILDHPIPAAGGGFWRIFTAYDVASGERLWRHQLGDYRSVEIAGSTLVVRRAKAVSEIDLVTGAMTTEDADPTPRPSAAGRKYVVAAFDEGITQLLWVADVLGETGRLAVLDDAIFVVSVQSRSLHPYR